MSSKDFILDILLWIFPHSAQFFIMMQHIVYYRASNSLHYVQTLKSNHEFYIGFHKFGRNIGQRPSHSQC